MTNPLILPAGPHGPVHGPLHRVITTALEAAGGWIGFDAFMALALYAPGLGYYAGDSPKFGLMPAGAPNGGSGSGSDFATAPEMSPHFGRALARQVADAFEATDTRQIWEFGAGTGALAQQLLDQLGSVVERYTIVDVSGSLRERQRLRLGAHADKVRWASELPARFSGVVVGNEVLDAMPVKILARTGGVWHERGVALHEDRLTYADPADSVDAAAAD